MLAVVCLLIMVVNIISDGVQGNQGGVQNQGGGNWSPHMGGIGMKGWDDGRENQGEEEVWK